MLIVQGVDLAWDFVWLVEVELSKEERNNLSTVFVNRHFFRDFVEYAPMRVISWLDEAVAKNSHFVKFESVRRHHFKNFGEAVLKEVKLSLLGVHVQKTVCNVCQSLHHKLD